MIDIRVGGVPEHFNLPWHLCIEEGLFEKAGINVIWKDFPGGTGAMTRELRHDGLDLAIVLTEGMIADIALGNKSKIISFYTTTPLVWGVHSTAYNRFEVIKDVDPPIFAISRWGSGSHLMAYLLAKSHGLNPQKDIEFKVVSNLEGALKSLGEKSSNLFMWEKFTTKPYVDSGELKRLTDYPTPWPCFVLAARNSVIKSRKNELKKVMEIVLKRAQELKNDPNSVELIASRYALKPKDVKIWLDATNWESVPSVDQQVIADCSHVLTDLAIIKSDIELEEIIESV